MEANYSYLQFGAGCSTLGAPQMAVLPVVSTAIRVGGSLL